MPHPRIPAKNDQEGSGFVGMVAVAGSFSSSRRLVGRIVWVAGRHVSLLTERSGSHDCQSFDCFKIETPFGSNGVIFRRTIDFARLRLTWQLATAAHSRIRRRRGFCRRDATRERQVLERSAGRRRQMRLIFRYASVAHPPSAKISKAAAGRMTSRPSISIEAMARIAVGLCLPWDFLHIGEMKPVNQPRCSASRAPALERHRGGRRAEISLSPSF